MIDFFLSFGLGLFWVLLDQLGAKPSMQWRKHFFHCWDEAAELFWLLVFLAALRFVFLDRPSLLYFEASPTLFLMLPILYFMQRKLEKSFGYLAVFLAFGFFVLELFPANSLLMVIQALAIMLVELTFFRILLQGLLWRQRLFPAPQAVRGLPLLLLIASFLTLALAQVRGWGV